MEGRRPVVVEIWPKRCWGKGRRGEVMPICVSARNFIYPFLWQMTHRNQRTRFGGETPSRCRDTAKTVQTPRGGHADFCRSAESNFCGGHFHSFNLPDSHGKTKKLTWYLSLTRHPATAEGVGAIPLEILKKNLVLDDDTVSLVSVIVHLASVAHSQQ